MWFKPFILNAISYINHEYKKVWRLRNLNVFRPIATAERFEWLGSECRRVTDVFTWKQAF